MNKLMIALGLVATVALVGCNKDKAPETGATTGEHLENAADQAGHDMQDASREAAVDTERALIMQRKIQLKQLTKLLLQRLEQQMLLLKQHEKPLRPLQLRLKKVLAMFEKKLKTDFSSQFNA